MESASHVRLAENFLIANLSESFAYKALNTLLGDVLKSKFLEFFLEFLFVKRIFGKLLLKTQIRRLVKLLSACKNVLRKLFCILLSTLHQSGGSG